MLFKQASRGDERVFVTVKNVEASSISTISKINSCIMLARPRLRSSKVRKPSRRSPSLSGDPLGSLLATYTMESFDCERTKSAKSCAEPQLTDLSRLPDLFEQRITNWSPLRQCTCKTSNQSKQAIKASKTSNQSKQAIKASNQSNQHSHSNVKAYQLKKIIRSGGHSPQ